jgi:hypothetical protein
LLYGVNTVKSSHYHVLESFTQCYEELYRKQRARCTASITRTFRGHSGLNAATTTCDFIVAYETCVKKALPKPEVRARFYREYVFAPFKANANGDKFRDGTEVWASRVGASLQRDLISIRHFFHTVARNGKNDQSEVTTCVITLVSIRQRYDALAKKYRKVQREKAELLAQTDIAVAAGCESESESLSVESPGRDSYFVEMLDNAPEMCEPELEREPDETQPNVDEDEQEPEAAYFEDVNPRDPFAIQGHGFDYEAVNA